MKKRGLTKFGLLSENSAFGQSGKKETHAVAGKYGMQIVADEMYGPKDADVTTQLTKIKNTAGVQAIFVFGFGQGPAVVTKNIGQLGITLPHYESHGVASEEYIKLSGKAAEGVRLPAAALLVATSPAEQRSAEDRSWSATRRPTRTATSRTSRPSAATRTTV